MEETLLSDQDYGPGHLSAPRFDIPFLEQKADLQSEEWTFGQKMLGSMSCSYLQAIGLFSGVSRGETNSWRAAAATLKVKSEQSLASAWRQPGNAGKGREAGSQAAGKDIIWRSHGAGCNRRERRHR